MTTSDKIAYVAIGLVVGGLITGLVVTSMLNSAWQMKLDNAKPIVTIVHDTITIPKIVIREHLQPGKRDTLRVPVPMTLSDSASLRWGKDVLLFWAMMGYSPFEARYMQDSLTVDRSLSVISNRGDSITAHYLPLSDFLLTLDEIRTPIISNDTTIRYSPIAIPKTFFDEMVQYGGYVLSGIIAILYLVK